MAEVVPFKALRFTEKAGRPSDLCCPPYDIISEEQRRAYLAENEHNIIRLELPRDGEDPYRTASDVLKKWLDDGVLATDADDSFYIYGEEFTINGVTRSFKGIIGRVKLEEFSKAVILPHENTLSKAKDDRLNLMKATNCNFSEIYSLYFDDEHTTADVIASITDNTAPCAEFTDAEGVTHRLWICTDRDTLNMITEQFKERKLYIADGHHRYETGLNYRNYRRADGKSNGNMCDGTSASVTVSATECDSAMHGYDYIMMMLVNIRDEGLVVLPTHRIVRDLENFDFDDLKNKAASDFIVDEMTDRNEMNERLDAAYNNGAKAFGCITDKGIYLFTLKKKPDEVDELSETAPSLRQLDVTVLHSLILEKYLGIDKENMAAQINLTYTRDIDEGENAVKSGADACFILNPTRITEIAEVAAAGEKMPQKSTYFYPKLITGLVMNKLDD